MKPIQNLNYQLIQADKKNDKLLNSKWTYAEGRIFLKTRIQDKNSIFLVAEFEGELVGYLTGSIIKIQSWRPVRRTEIEEMFVKKNFRSRGVGSKLVKKFIEWSRKKRAGRILVIVYAENKKGITFYKKLGFFEDKNELEMEVR